MRPYTLFGLSLTLAFLLCIFCPGSVGQDQVSPEAKARVENARDLQSAEESN